MFRLMKAVSATLEQIPTPCYGGVKYDGIRAVVKDGVVLSLALKPIPNKNIQTIFGRECYNGLDMELVVGDVYSPDCFRNTTSVVMSHEKPIDGLKAYVFDYVLNQEDEYPLRKLRVLEVLREHPNRHLVDACAKLVETEDELYSLLEKERLLGGEGLVARKLTSKYKYGRSTLKEGYLYKVKFYKQDEFKVVGFTEQMCNGNEATIDESGYTSRSLSKEGLTPKGTLGALILEGNGVQFNCGTGFDDNLRQEVWNNRDKYLNKLVSVRYMATGIKEAPRHPVFIGFRHEDDLANSY